MSDFSEFIWVVTAFFSAAISVVIRDREDFWDTHGVDDTPG
jgi:hypothetical protein